MRWRWSNPAPDSPGEQGSVTVLGAALVAVLLVLTAAAGAVGAVVVARHRAHAAADLAALAAAAALPAGANTACARAADLASAMRTVLTECVVEELDVVVRVAVAVRVGRWGVGSARAAARAGPSGRAP